jgi:CS domain
MNNDTEQNRIEEEKKSALEHNIKTKGEYSYYYAHGRKFQEKEQGETISGPGIITGGDPVLLQQQKKEIEVIKETNKFTKYQFYDDDKFVKIRIELGDLKDKVKDDGLIPEFSEKSFNLKVIVVNSDPYYFSIKKLAKKIVPSESNVKIIKDKLVIALKKVDEDEEWDKLNA